MKDIYIPEKKDFFESMSSSYDYDVGYMKKDKFWQKAIKDYNELFLNATKVSGEYRIPKKIHQIWLGSPFPKEYINWQKSWKKHHPDWEYFLWTDENVKDLKFTNPGVFEKTTNFGAKSDILRYEILNQFGGLYIDTDFECFHPFDFLHLNLDFYSGIVYGEEFSSTTGLLGSIPNHPILNYLLKRIDKHLISDDIVEIHEITGPWALAKAFKKFMFDDNYRNLALPTSYFYPFPNNKLHIRSEKKIKQYVRPESLAIHYWEVSWKRRGNALSGLLRYIPPEIKNKVKNFLKKSDFTR